MRQEGSYLWAARILGIGSSRKRGKRKHITSSIIVIACSVIPLVIAIYLANGMTAGITGKYVHLSSFHAQLDADMPLPEEGLDSIKGIYPVRETFCLLYSQNGSYTTNVKGIDSDYLNSKEVQKELTLLSGDYEIFDGADIILSQEIADDLEVKIDDTIAVVTVTQQSGQARIKPSIFHVKGIVESGYLELDAYIAFIDIEQARRVMKDDLSEYTGIFVDSELAESPEEIKTLLSPYGSVITWDMLNRSLYSNFQTSKMILYIIMVLIIIIATFNVSSTCIMLIQEKYIDIGLMKSIGVRQSTIGSTFRIISVTIGFIGSVIGIIIGIILSLQLNTILKGLQILGISALDFYLIELPVIINWEEILIVGVLTTVLSGLSSVIPIRRIQNILPIHMLSD